MSQKVMMISGANRGIGQALARAFGGAGWALSLGMRTPEPAGDALVCRYDAEDLLTAREWVAATEARFGRIDGLVCNAGTAATVALADATPDALDQMWRVNTRGPFFLVQAALGALKRSGAGRVGIVASLSGKRARNMNAGYQVTKFAAVGLAHAIRAAAWNDGVRAVAICPSYVRTRMGLQSGSVKAEAVTDPDELAGLVLQVMSLSNTAGVSELIVNCSFEPGF